MYDDLLVGKVIRIDTRPGKMHGWIEITSGDADKIGTTIWFHYNDGVFLDFDGDDIQWGASSILDDDLIIDEPYHKGVKGLRRLTVPTVGDELIFDLGINDRGPKAGPWTHLGYFQTFATIRDHWSNRIVDASGTTVCAWRYNPAMDTVLIDEGSLPETLDDTMVVEYYEPEDIAYDGDLSFLIPSAWFTHDHKTGGEALDEAKNASRKLVLTEN